MVFSDQIPVYGEGEMTIYILVFLIGAAIGSFLNVCIHRIPAGGSIIFPPSHCPSCKAGIRFYDNIPIISYLLLRGRCRQCKSLISSRYPIVESINGIGYMLLLYEFGLGWPLLAYTVFFSSLIVLTFIDLSHQILPDLITLPGIIVGLIAASSVLPAGMINSIIGVLLGGGAFYLVAVISRGGMGGGDIKLIAMIGAFLGWRDVLLTIFIGALTGSLVGIFLMLFKGKKRKDPIPFGPFLAAGAVISVFLDRELFIWYVNLRGG